MNYEHHRSASLKLTSLSEHNDISSHYFHFNRNSTHGVLLYPLVLSILQPMVLAGNLIFGTLQNFQPPDPLAFTDVVT
ncbi:hypothetical protein C5167_024789 [Papaver somniferum]|uniref:Uncharacterized protein n=1 Tax=Papaver somniferum TaxID=3469 RepID=A0A4Y7JTB3_PAPSO|nr:hypothetical protein C5167_024789 [Papaver somniferum]